MIRIISSVAIFIFLSIFHAHSLFGQDSTNEGLTIDRPKLIVGITVDQMRNDFIYRFWNKYGEKGFKRLVNGGYYFENAKYSYRPTYTAPGHASIYTGTTPAVHGIVANQWYDRYQKKSVYCAEDESVSTVGSVSDAGKMSPRNMLSTTITDELRLANSFNSKTIGISLKDRGAILPAGHTANGAYWFDSSEGVWISSTYYGEELPDWVKSFNKKERILDLLSEEWTTLLPIKSYTESLADNNPFEAPFATEKKPEFPHKLFEIKDRLGYGVIASTPFGNTMTKNLAKEAINGEDLGKDEYTDFLAVSFSSTDYIGHQFGPRSIEIEDAYLRLDQDIADLLEHLDKTVGVDNYLVFLTADHGAAEVPLYLQNMNIPAGYFEIETYKREIIKLLITNYGAQQWVRDFSNDQIFLDHDIIKEQGVDINKMTDDIVQFSLTYPGISGAISANDLISGNFITNSSLDLVQRGHNQKLSGDVHIIMNPAWMIYFRQGTTHGSSYPYDTHVPVIFYGKGVIKNRSFEDFNVVDIAPTLAAMLRIQAPNGSVGKVHAEVFRN